MQSRQVVRSWATARMSLIVKEDKSSMKNFIESPSFPELSKQARKTNESKEMIHPGRAAALSKTLHL